ncbi:MAG: hypothetical protein HY805_07190 [Nitrospirae bacterium]|nr:hypothetical protein [Nitrospirota bacterium]
MFTLLRRLLCLGIILTLIFIGISVFGGGERFRWLGNILKIKSDKVAEKADSIKKTTEDTIWGTAKELKKSKEMEKTVDDVGR